MPVRIRLRKVTRTKKIHHYRIVVADSRSARDTKFIEEIGYYNPAKEHIKLKLDKERYDYWVSKGAQPSDTVRSLAKKVKNDK